MRKLLLPSLLAVAVFMACENKSPVGPNGVGPGGLVVTQTTSTTTTTTTTTIAPTTTTSSTSTSVVGSLSRRYVAFPPAPNAPADMTLFFQLIASGSPLTSLVERLPILGMGPMANGENEYKVTGVYLMGNGTAGNVEGELGGALNPLETGGEFEGTMTARVGSCTAERAFSGDLGPQSLDWDGGRTISDCSGSPLSMSGFSLVRSDAPLPSTTTIPAPATCTYSVTPSSGSAPGEGGVGDIVIATQSTCSWTAQSLAPWLTLSGAQNGTVQGTGNGVVQWRASANFNGPARTGTIIVNGVTFNLTFSVAQAAPLTADLIPAFPIDDNEVDACEFDSSGRYMQVYTRNVGAARAAAQTSTHITFSGSPQPDTTLIDTLEVGGELLIRVPLPAACIDAQNQCRFTVRVDATSNLFEGSVGEANNVLTGSCFNSKGSVTGAAIKTVVRR